MTHRTESERALAAELLELRARVTIEEQRAYRESAENEIARSEAKFRRLFETAHDGILILNATSGEITDVNPYLSSLLGYTEEEILGRKLWELGPFQDTATSQVAFKELQANAYIRYEDLPLQARDGRTVDVEFVSNLYDVNGEPVIQCNIRDITERKRTEEDAYQHARVTALRAAVGLSLSEPGPFAVALRGCCEAFVMHFSASLAQIWTCEPSGDDLTLAANAGAAAQPDVELNRMTAGRSMMQRIVESGEPMTTNNVLDEPEICDRDWAVRQRIVAFAGYPLKVEGRVVGVLALFSEARLSDAVLATLNSLPNHLALTIERRHRSRDVAIAEERLRFAMESAYVGVWDMDIESGTVGWSSVMEAQYGLPPGGFAGTFEAFVQGIHPDDREATLATIERAGRTGRDYSVVHRTLHPSGAVRWVRGEGRFLLDAQGAAVRASGISLDITEQMALASQDQQAQKMEAVGRLAGGVAHDFNNLLTVMLGFCEIVLGSLREDDSIRGDLLEIQKAATRAATLTRQLLTFSRRSIIEPRVLDINEVLNGLLPMIVRLLGEDMRIVTHLRSGAARVVADPSQLEQVIVNLAVNARDSMPNGGTLSIESSTVELDESYVAMHLNAKPGSYVVLTITDTGAGMSPEVMKHIFEPFFTTKPRGEGTGLGLATVHGIVMQNGGTIGVYSELGQGTSFNVYLPLVSDGGESHSAALPDVPPLGGTETILVVEDAAPLRAVTRRMLERVGYVVIVAASATEAKRRFEQRPEIALVLTDVVMPGGNGPELSADLQVLRPGLRVVFMSGYSEDAIGHHGVLAPDIAFLQKPFTAVALLRKIREKLDA